MVFWYIMEYQNAMLDLKRVRTVAGGSNSFCLSCSAQLMVETAAHLVNQGFSPLPVR